MRYWDTSALLSIIVEEKRSAASRDLLRADPEIITWTFTSLELLSACCRRRRERSLDEKRFDAARRRLARLASRARLVGDVPEIRAHAEAALLASELRAADALQLAAALVWVEGRARGRQFVCADDHLLAAAASAGFTTIRPA